MRSVSQPILSGQPGAGGSGDEALAWLSAHRNLSVEWSGPVYGDDDEPEEWRVVSESGGINDREWATVGTGATPLEAILAARARLSPPSRGATARENGNTP